MVFSGELTFAGDNVQKMDQSGPTGGRRTLPRVR